MFSARDKNGNTVDIKNVFNINEQFYCLNKECTAKFIIKSPNSYKAKHFARLPSTQHIEGCIYNLASHIYNPNNVVKLPLEEILLKQKSDKTSSKTHGKKNNSSKTSENIRISTPKQLFDFCVSNPLNTEYLDGKTINDIVVDIRNIEKKYKGIQGIFLVIGKIVLVKSKYFIFRVMLNKDGRVFYLTATVHTSSQQIKEIIKYLNKTYNTKKIKDLPIAVLGDWKIDEKYKISCTVTNKRNVIYRFKSSLNYNP